MNAPEYMVLILKCTICGWESLCQNGLCIDCRDIRESARIGRSMCQLIHRDIPAAKAVKAAV